MKVYSERCTQNIVNNNKTQYKQANLTTVLQSTMFDRGKFEVNDFCFNLFIVSIYICSAEIIFVIFVIIVLINKRCAITRDIHKIPFIG